MNNINQTQQSNTGTNTDVSNLAQVWAKKYMQGLSVDAERVGDLSDANAVLSPEGREQTTEKLRKALRFTSAQAWAKTEKLLAQQVQKHNIEPDLIDPWQVSVDCHALFDKTLDIYKQSSVLRHLTIASVETPTELPSLGKLATQISKDVGRIRHKVTAKDPRVLGFVSMQFHYSGQILLQLLNPIEKATVSSYFKVIDDHLYMPLQRAYDAAAEHALNSPELIAVRELMPITSEISQAICDRAIAIYPAYNCYGGQLQSHSVKASSLRDVEMFQIYLCLCVLEGNISSIQEELFPLCVMLYPPLNVSWGLIRTMIKLLERELDSRLMPSNMYRFRPYVKALEVMFSEDVLADSPLLAAV